MMTKFKHTIAALAICGAATMAHAHGGRRYEVMIDDNQLVVQGYNSAEEDDGGGVRRPHYNALHDHFHNLPTVDAASADLPGYDLFDGGDLTGYDLTLTLLGGSKWVNPPAMPDGDTVVSLESLSAAETIFVTIGSETVDTTSGRPLALAVNIGSGGAAHLDLSYDIGLKPQNVIYVLEFELSTNAPGVTTSGSIFTALSPDGDNMTEKLHHASLFLEQYLGTPIPEPTTASVIGIAGLALFARRRRTRA